MRNLKKKKRYGRVRRGRCQDENLTNSASDAAEVKGTQPKKVKDEIKARCAAVPGGTAENLSLQGKATADARQTRS